VKINKTLVIHKRKTIETLVQVKLLLLYDRKSNTFLNPRNAFSTMLQELHRGYAILRYSEKFNRYQLYKSLMMHEIG